MTNPSPDPEQKNSKEVPGKLSAPTAEVVAEIVDFCRCSRLGKKQEDHDYNFDNSRSQCIFAVERLLSAAFPTRSWIRVKPENRRGKYVE